MDISTWNYYYKLSPNNEQWTTNLLYSPRVNDDKTIMCMNWDHKDPYQIRRNRTADEFTEDLVDFFYQREIKYLQELQGHSWSPKLIDLDEKNRRIFIEWCGESCNQLLGAGHNLDEYCSSWREQMFTMLDELLNKGYYKMSLYPHCFFFDENKNLKTIDFYGCVETKYPYIETSLLKGVIGEDSVGRFSQSMEGNLINFEKFFKNTIKNYIKWPGDPLQEFYTKRFTND
jgi:hypothetical protein